MMPRGMYDAAGAHNMQSAVPCSLRSWLETVKGPARRGGRHGGAGADGARAQGHQGDGRLAGALGEGGTQGLGPLISITNP